MSVSLQTPWTQDQVFAWAEAQEGRYEFDGFAPVAMAGRTINHSLIAQNIYAAFRQALRGSGCHKLAMPELGIEIPIAAFSEQVEFPTFDAS